MEQDKKDRQNELERKRQDREERKKLLLESLNQSQMSAISNGMNMNNGMVPSQSYYRSPKTSQISSHISIWRKPDANRFRNQQFMSARYQELQKAYYDQVNRSARIREIYSSDTDEEEEMERSDDVLMSMDQSYSYNNKSKRRSNHNSGEFAAAPPARSNSIKVRKSSGESLINASKNNHKDRQNHPSQLFTADIDHSIADRNSISSQSYNTENRPSLPTTAPQLTPLKNRNTSKNSLQSNQSFFNKPNDAQISATQRRDVRVVPVVKSRQVDITTCGGNTRGVFIANIGQITYYQKKIQLKEGDKIIAVNNFPLVDVTREDAQKIINDAIGNKSKSRNLVWFSVINDMYDYSDVRKYDICDNFYIKITAETLLALQRLIGNIHDVRKVFNVEIGDIIRVTNSMYPEITYGNKENLTISEDQYENWLHNEGVNRHGCHSYKGQVVHRSVKDNGRIRSGEELKKKEKDKINQMEEIVYLPGLRHIYTKVEPSDKPRKPTIILHSTFATELKSTLINTDPKNFCDGYLPKTTHYPVFVEKVRDTILPDNAQINRLTLEEDVINLIVFAKDQQFLKHIGKKYQKSIGESITLKYEKKQSVQSFEGLRSEVIGVGF